jgi:hypothetical protein
MLQNIYKYGKLDTKEIKWQNNFNKKEQIRNYQNSLDNGKISLLSANMILN